MENFKKAIDEKVVGLGDKLTSSQQWEMKYLDSVIDKLKSNQYFNREYIYNLPEPFVKKYLTGKRFINDAGLVLTIIECHLVDSQKDYSVAVEYKNHPKTKNWRMWLSTILRDVIFIDPIKEKYLRKVTQNNFGWFLKGLLQKKQTYQSWYKQLNRNANTIIANKLYEKTSDMKVTREAIRKSIRNIQQDSKVIADAWNSTLNKQEQDTLIKWLASNIYSMRLYTTKDSRWDKAICELYPEETYGKHRQTEASELSKDSINGYISLSSTEGIPLGLLKKITHKEKESDIIKQNIGSNKFRINNYLLVLYLLNNYNKNGFKLGKTGLNKDIKL